MSRYANFPESEGHFVASTSGWGDVVKWSESVPVEGHEELVHLVEHGFAQDVESLEAQIARARQKFAPAQNGFPDVSAILETLEALLAAHDDAPTVVISEV